MIGRPECLDVELDTIRTLLEIARCNSFSLWVEGNRLRYRHGLMGDPAPLRWADAGALVLLWRLGRRSAAVLDTVTLARKPAARAAARTEKRVRLG